MRKSAAEKEARGHAGKFRVASELCRRNMWAHINLNTTYPHGKIGGTLLAM